MTGLEAFLCNFDAVETIKNNAMNMKHASTPQLVVTRREYLKEMRNSKRRLASK